MCNKQACLVCPIQLALFHILPSLHLLCISARCTALKMLMPSLAFVLNGKCSVRSNLTFTHLDFALSTQYIVDTA